MGWLQLLGRRATVLTAAQLNHCTRHGHVSRRSCCSKDGEARRSPRLRTLPQMRRGANSHSFGRTGSEAEHRVKWAPPDKTSDERHQAYVSPRCLRTDECEGQYPRSDNNAQNSIKSAFICFHNSLLRNVTVMSKSKTAVGDKVTLRRRGAARHPRGAPSRCHATRRVSPASPWTRVSG